MKTYKIYAWSKKTGHFFQIQDARNAEEAFQLVQKDTAKADHIKKQSINFVSAEEV